MKRRKFLSLAPTTVFIPFVTQYCTEDEFDQISIVDSGELEMGAKWAVTEFEVIPNSEVEVTESPEELPNIIDVESEYIGTNTRYLDAGNVYTITVDIEVPILDAIDGINLDFDDFGGLPWKVFFEIGYTDITDDWEFIHPPKQKHITYTVEFTFEFERYLQQYFVWLENKTPKNMSKQKRVSKYSTEQEK